MAWEDPAYYGPRIKHCVKCEESSWAPEDRSVGIMGPTLEDCNAEICPFGNKWDDYANSDDKIDWEGEEDEWEGMYG
jgi:hypothetical protein